MFANLDLIGNLNISSILFVGVNHCFIVLHGTELVSRYKGYGSRVEWDGPYNDKTPRTQDGSIDNTVIAIDALMFPTGQFDRSCIDRDMCKAYVGFSYPYPADHFLAGLDKKDVSTGKWGCGVFGGDIEMKFLQQWIAVSAGEPGRKMIFATFHDKDGVPDRLKKIMELCKKGYGEKPEPITTVKQLYDKMIQYAKYRSSEERKYAESMSSWSRKTQLMMQAYRMKVNAAEEAGEEPPERPVMPEQPKRVQVDFISFLKGGPDSQCVIC